MFHFFGRWGGVGKMKPLSSKAMVKRWGVSEFESWEGEGTRSQHLALSTVRRKHMPTLEMWNVSDKLNIYYSMQLCFPILRFQLIGNTYRHINCMFMVHDFFFIAIYVCWSQCYKKMSGFAEFQVLLQLLQGWFGAIDGDKTKIRMVM